ncbi:MAG: DUF3825 domain-containing protein [Eubacteriales bacterium]|nr:DUF3825 domain-containing protein [Eubacteriales bacterium]
MDDNKMDKEVKNELNKKIIGTIKELQVEADSWINLATLGNNLNRQGISYKELGYIKLKPFIQEFSDCLEFSEINEPGKTPVIFVRPKVDDGMESTLKVQSINIHPEEQNQAFSNTTYQNLEHCAHNQNYKNASSSGHDDHNSFRPGKYPQQGTKLENWAFVHWSKYTDLSELALPEKWYYGDAPEEGTPDQPLLRNYLNYTFQRLAYEDKILYSVNSKTKEEYATFNTGLVDRKYEYIYAFFLKNTRFDETGIYWFLLDFVVAGEDAGKILGRIFNPLPARADYFENRIENMLYDTTTGPLHCDYTHIITERTYRLPPEFLEDNCPPDMLDINGNNLNDIRTCSDFYERKAYFEELGQRIYENSRIFNRITNRFEDAVDLALKRTEWNYRTAIPTYYPKRNQGSLLLPLALTDETQVDLALVVIRNPSGSYQGETVLPLDIAYKNSRLVTRPDSDWLRTEVIHMENQEDDFEED